ncbi:MAG: AAA family ATPase [Chloroflexota bacterium]
MHNSPLDTQRNIPRLNGYTDAPLLHPNFFVGSIHLVFWFFFHPSAWHNFIKRLAPDLSATFTLAELNLDHWRNPQIQRLLLQGFFLWPLLFALIVGIEVWITGVERNIDAASITFGVIGVLIGGIAIGTVINMAAGVVLVALASVISIIGTILIDVLPDMEPFTLEAILVAVWVGITGYVASHLTPTDRRPALPRQVGSIIIGVIISSLLLQIVLSIVAGASALSNSAPTFALILAGIFTVVITATFGTAIRWRTGNWRRAIIGSVLVFVVIGVGGGSSLAFAAQMVETETLFRSLVGTAMGVAVGFIFCTMFALPYLLAERLAGPWAGAASGILGSSGVYIGFSIYVGGYTLSPIVPLTISLMLLSLSIGWWRPLLTYPFQAAWHLILFRLDQRQIMADRGQPNSEQKARFLRWHAAFWDEQQWLPWTGLEDHLVLISRYDEAEGQAALSYLAAGPQRRIVQAAQIELDADRLVQCTTSQMIAQAHQDLAAGDLAGPASALLRSFSRISQDVAVGLQQESTYNQRLALRAIEDRLDGLLRELTRSSEPYAFRFRPIATHWRQVIADNIAAQTEAVERKQEIDNPYIIGVPLTEKQEIFVGRTDISTHIEQLLLDRRRPPLLLYGQRRMGKTSLLNNLGRLLPSTVVPLFVDLQGPASRAQDHAGFLYNIARSMRESARRHRNLELSVLDRDALIIDPFTVFDEWLDAVEALLENRDQLTALLAFDEFETLDIPFQDGRFSESAVLGMFRNIIQHRPRFKILLTGSHTLDELHHWASYLINVQTLHVGYLKPTEARQLIETPTMDFALTYEPDACAQVIAVTRGHPALLQLLCAEIVALKNEQSITQRRLATKADVEAAIPEALIHGSFFFADIQRNQVDETGIAILKVMADNGSDAVTSVAVLADTICDQSLLENALALLQRRELIEKVDAGYRFQVELIRRWFAQ